MQNILHIFTVARNHTFTQSTRWWPETKQTQITTTVFFRSRFYALVTLVDGGHINSSLAYRCCSITKVTTSPIYSTRFPNDDVSMWWPTPRDVKN